MGFGGDSCNTLAWNGSLEWESCSRTFGHEVQVGIPGNICGKSYSCSNYRKHKQGIYEHCGITKRSCRSNKDLQLLIFLLTFCLFVNCQFFRHLVSLRLELSQCLA